MNVYNYFESGIEDSGCVRFETTMLPPPDNCLQSTRPFTFFLQFLHLNGPDNQLNHDVDVADCESGVRKVVSK